MIQKDTAKRRSTRAGLLILALTAAGAANLMAVLPPSDKGDHVVTGGDLAFMNAAAPGGMAEVALGRLAVKQGASTGVQQFGEKMIADHSKAGEKLQRLATDKRVTLPSELMPEHKQTMEKLSKLSGADFDRAYVGAMVTAHVSDVAAFKNVAKNATDADVKAFAARTLPTLEMHLQMINALAGKMGVRPADEK